jgi:acyl carrier protein
MEATAEHTLADLGLDAIDIAHLSMAVEDACNIELADSEVEAWQCVADVLASVAKVTA